MTPPSAPHPPTLRHLSGWRGNLLLLAAGTLVALFLLEAFLRVYNPLGVRVRGDRIVLPRNVRETMTNAANPKLDRVIVFSKNSLGFRGPEPPRDFDRQLSILVVGGSTTECLYLSDGASWPELLGGELARSFDRLWLNNAGLDGHSTFGHILLLEQMVLRLRPRVIVFLVGLNDVGRELPTGREVVSRPRPLAERLARHSAIVANALDLRRNAEARSLSLGYREVDLETTRQLAADRPRALALAKWHREHCLPGYRGRVQELVRACRSHGIEPVLMTQPALYGQDRDDVTGVSLRWIEVDGRQRIHGGLAWRVLEEYNDVVRAVGREQDLLVIDLARRLPKSSRLYYDFVHFANDGAHEVAAIAAAELCPFLARRFPDHAARPCPSRALRPPAPPSVPGQDLGPIAR